MRNLLKKQCIILFLISGCTNAAQEKSLTATDSSVNERAIKDTLSAPIEVPKTIASKDSLTQPTDVSNNHGNSIDEPIDIENNVDSVRIQKALHKILNIEEVQSLDKLIRKNTSSKHGVAIMTFNNFQSDTSCFQFMVGDNSRADRYENIYTFSIKKSGDEIKIYDPALDSVMSLSNWRQLQKTRK